MASVTPVTCSTNRRRAFAQADTNQPIRGQYRGGTGFWTQISGCKERELDFDSETGRLFWFSLVVSPGLVGLAVSVVSKTNIWGFILSLLSSYYRYMRYAFDPCTGWISGQNSSWKSETPRVCPEGQSRGEREWLMGVREREQEWIIPFPKVGNGKRMIKEHS